MLSASIIKSLSKIIEEVMSQNIEDVLSLIKEYQVFYGVEKIDGKKNQEFFSIHTKPWK